MRSPVPRLPRSWFWSIVGTLFFLFYLTRTELLGSPGGSGIATYSQYPGFRLQTDALLSGSIALSELPVSVERLEDFAYSAEGGLQQVWGLGVPLLRLPFEFGARLFGSAAFPDRLLWGLFLFASLAFLASSVRLWLETRKDGHELQTPRALTVLWLMLFAFSPPMLGILQTRMGVYEEAVHHGQLFCWILTGLALRFEARGSARTLGIACLLCGLAAFFRPTSLLFSGPLAFFLLHRQASSGARRWLGAPVLTGLALFFVGLVLLAWSNHLRFGSPLSFGHELNFMSNATNGRLIRFGLFTTAPLADRFRELFGVLFLPVEHNGYGFFKEGLVIGQSELVRFREFYFANFGAVTLLALAGSIAALFSEAGRPLLRACTARASLVSSVLLAGFYVFTPSITSRYLADLSTSFSLLIALGTTAWVGRARPALQLRWIGAILLAILLVALMQKAPNGLPQSRPAFASQAWLSRLPSLDRKVPILDELSCVPGQLTPRSLTGLRWRWKTPGDCTVQTLSWVMLREARCLEVSIRSPEGVPPPPIPHVRRDLKDLAPAGTTSSEQGVQHRKFCSEEPAPTSKNFGQPEAAGQPPRPRVAQYTVLWDDPPAAVSEPRQPFEVLRVRVLDQ